MIQQEYFQPSFLFVLLIVGASFSPIAAQPFDGFIRFDGIDDELSVSASDLFPAGSGYTLEFWFKSCQNPLESNQAFLGNFNNIEINMFPGLNFTYYQLCAIATNNVLICHQDHSYPADLNWHHLAVTYDYSRDEFEFYFDGMDGSISNMEEYNFSVAGFLLIGRSGFQPWYDHFNGFMDEMRISDTVRYAGSFPPPENEFMWDANTIGLWHFNERGTPDSVLDHSGNDFHFSTTGNPTLIKLDSLFDQTNNTLTVVDSFDSYQWVDCSKGYTLIPGETNQSLTITTPGSYAVEITEGGCLFTSPCMNASIVTGIPESEHIPAITISPNPATDQITLLGSAFPIDEIAIVDLTGKLIQKGNRVSHPIPVANLAKGIYFLHIRIGNRTITRKFAKQ